MSASSSISLITLETHKTTKYLVSPLDDDVELDELDAAEPVAEAAAAWLVATDTELDEDEVAICCARELTGPIMTEEVRAVELDSVAELVGRATVEVEAVLDG